MAWAVFLGVGILFMPESYVAFLLISHDEMQLHITQMLNCASHSRSRNVHLTIAYHLFDMFHLLDLARAPP